VAHLKTRSAWARLAIAVGAVTVAALPQLDASSALRHRQSAPDREGFEVASVKRNLSRDAERDVEVSAGGRFTARYASLRDLVQLAYPLQSGRLRDESQLVAPRIAWFSSEHFDVIAKANGLPPGFDTNNIPAGAVTTTEMSAVDRVRAMLRRVLSERFALSAHNEIRETPVYALVFSRGDRKLGPRLRPVDVDCVGLRFEQPQAPAPVRDRAACGGFRGLGPGRYTAHGVSMTMIANQISGETDRVVIDQTGLGGLFDLDLEWTPQEVVDSFGPSLFTALQEQLGLKLESATAPLDVLVIDAASMPTPD
jgi:uncharacterized protein (TIGR03435 family)